MSSPVSERHKRILEIARRNGRVSVEELVAALGLTPQTIRKDLNDLCAQHVLSRVHGGAVLGSGVENLGYEARRLLAVNEKQAIGKAAAALIPDGASLFINIGTTTEEVARALAHRSNLMVITNNLNVVDILWRNTGIELIVVGGRIRHSDRASIGPSAVDFINNFKVDYGIIGASSIDVDGSLLDFDLNEVQVSHAIVQNSRSVMLVADRAKLSRSAPIRIGHLGDVDIFVTDCLDDPELLAVCEANGVRVVSAEVPHVRTVAESAI